MKKILCPVDFTDTSLNGLKYAWEMAKRFGSELILFHTMHVPVQNMDEGVLPVNLTDVEDHAKERLEAVCKGLEAENIDQGIDYYYILRFGFAEDEILNLIKEKHIDMVIMGTKGTEGIGKLFGTVSADIAAGAPCPVIVIPENYRFKILNEIVYTMNVLQKDDLLIQYITDFAKVFNAHISFLNIQKDNHEPQKIISDGIKMLEGMVYRNTSFDVLKNEDINSGIDLFAESRHADLIVMAPRERGLFQKIFSKSITRQEAYQTKIPLLAIHKEGMIHSEL
jgi:nucleotide-binding universal stress UspA family protein